MRRTSKARRWPLAAMAAAFAWGGAVTLAQPAAAAMDDAMPWRPVPPASPSLAPMSPVADLGRGGPALALLEPAAALSGLMGQVGQPLRSGPAATPVAGGRKAAAAPVYGPIVSGLAWRSGASCGAPEFAAWRGRRLDSAVLFGQHNTWDEMARWIGTDRYRNLVRQTPQPVISLAMMPETEQQQHARCARGEFDGYFRQFGTILSRIGAGDAIVRIGWEPNVGAKAHAWGVDTLAQARQFAKCFRREVDALRSTAPRVKIEWTMAKATIWPFSVLEAYPGDAYVDTMGIHYYDVNAQFNTQKKWDAFYKLSSFGGPQGLGTWVKTAAAHGKRLDVPEWGVWAREVTPPEADNPFYVQKMFDFFKANAPIIAYENYYNCPLDHRLFPGGPFPKASAKYKELWSKG